MKTLLLLVLLTSGLLYSENGRAIIPSGVSGGKPESGKLLTDWLDMEISAIKNTKNPSHHFRQICYTSIAFYESLANSDSKYRSLSTQLNGLNSLPEPSDAKRICWQASGNAAIAQMLKFFYTDNPVTTHRIDSTEKAWLTHLMNEGYSLNELESGSEYGKSIATAIIDWCKADGSDKENDAYTIPQGDGMWEPTPPKFGKAMRPWAANSRTVVPGSIDNALPPPPCTFSKDTVSDFYRMVMEVFRESEIPNKEHQAIALNWDDAPDGTSIGAGGHWLCILKNELTSRSIPLLEGAHIWAAMYIAMYDASIGCFKAKYTYNVIRPVTYIRKYMNRPDWNPLIITPSHPEYPAAHATISMAAATILAKLLGDNTGFVDNTYEYKGLKARNFNSFTDAGKEAGMSRLYGGIHYRPSIEAGYTMGEKIATNVLASLHFTSE